MVVVLFASSQIYRLLKFLREFNEKKSCHCNFIFSQIAR